MKIPRPVCGKTEFVKFLMFFKLISRLNAKILNINRQYPEDLQMQGLAIKMKYNYGFLASKQSQKPVDQSGEKIPWFTYPSIEFISSLDLSRLKIFEWGSGNSSAFFAKRAQSIISVESDPQWYEYGKSILASNQQLLLRTGDLYPMAIHEQKTKFEVIVIDGILRSSCARQAVPALARGGDYHFRQF